ncbi:MAG: hypothetical protein JXB88_07170 [Spirochaetales bacterium]|nr:hypothetical protein [Spirochaetales bacterium]
MVIEEKVKTLLADVLGLDNEEIEITPESDIVNDLAAESIDFIDICFRLEKDFQIGKVNPKDIFPPYFPASKYIDEAGRIKNEFKDTFLEQLGNEYPHMKEKMINEIRQNVENTARIPLKVKNIVEFTTYKLNEKKAKKLINANIIS